MSARTRLSANTTEYAVSTLCSKLVFLTRILIGSSEVLETGMNWLSWSISVGFVRRTDGHSSQDRRQGRGLESGDGGPHLRILVFAWPVAWISNRQPLQTVTSRTWLFLALSGLATALWLCYFRLTTCWRGIESGPRGQAECGGRHGARYDLPG